MPAAALLLDLDGTVVDSRADITTSANVVRAAYGLPAMDQAAVVACVGDGFTQLIKRILAGGQTDPAAASAQLEQAKQLFAEHYAVHCADHSTVFPEVASTLTELHNRGWLLAIVSNKPDAWCKTIVERLDLAPLLPVVVGGDGIRKPAPDPLWRACTQLDIPPQSAWMIGDHANDVLAGRAAGCRTCGVTWGFSDPTASAPDAVVEHAGQLLSVVGWPAE